MELNPKIHMFTKGRNESQLFHLNKFVNYYTYSNVGVSKIRGDAFFLLK
jgi:hypothetical protein